MMRISVVNSACYIDFDDWRIVVESKENGGEQEVKKLNDTTYRILEILASHAGEFVSKETLLREWRGVEIDRSSPYDDGYDDRYHSAVKSCRDLFKSVKIDEKEVIENRRGVGYCYNGRKITDGHPQTAELDMTDVRGFCIEDQDHSGCQVRRDESGPKATTAVIDFSLTDSRLCSVVYFTGLRDWSQLAADHKLCFEARAVPGPVRAEVEVRLRGGDFPYPVLIPEEGQTFEIPLSRIASAQAWSEVQEIHLLFRRRAVEARTAVTVENLRLES